MPPATAGWERLLALAVRERDLAAEGRWEELDDVGGERLALAAALGDAPPQARELLERTLAVHEELVGLLLRGREQTIGELGRLRRTRGAAQAYAAPAAASTAGWVDHPG
jgi:hypothetical protein